MEERPFHPGGGFGNLAIELYSAGEARYVFDARKVVFIEVGRRVFLLLQLLRDRDLDVDGAVSALPELSESEVRQAFLEVRKLQEKGYLLPSDLRRSSPHRPEEFEEVLTRRLGGFTVHVTTQCNLACSYCLYAGGYDRHGALSGTAMPWETARNMVDFLVQNSKESEEVRLDFFGGEPLLAFDLLRRTVNYAEAALGSSGPSLTVTVSTNGTLLDDEILDFLLGHQVYIQFSIDGTKEVHDRERRFRSGRGSHDLVFRNLERLHDRSPDYVEKHVRVKSVITPESLDEADDGFLEHPLIRTVAKSGHLSTLVTEPKYDLRGDAPYFEAISRLGEALSERTGVETLAELVRPLTFRQRQFFADTFEAFLEVQGVNALYFRDPSSITFTKGCLMGSGEGAVLPSGEITVCHKATSFVIGNVNEGRWDFERLQGFQSSLYRPWPACASCFAARFCDLCHEKLDGSSGDEAAGRNRFCDFTRRKHHLVFGWMLQILAQNPMLWADLEKVVRSRMKEAAEARTAGRSPSASASAAPAPGSP